MVLAALVLAFQAAAVPATAGTTTDGVKTPIFFATNVADERTPLAAFQLPVATSSPAPAQSRFENDGIRVLNFDEDGKAVKLSKDDPVFPDETSKILSSVHIPPQLENLPPLPERRIPVLRPSHAWLMLAIAQSSAASFDAWTTNRAVAQGHPELNPILKPVAGSPVIYAAIQATPVLMDFIARKMQHSEYTFVRRMWWLPQTIGTATSLTAGIRNLAITH